MATDLEKLVVQLQADIRQYQSEMQKAQGVTDRNAKAIVAKYQQMDRRLGSIGKSAARSLVVPLTSVAAALSIQEVFKYADAWTKAKNSLAVAGVTGGKQADILEQLYQSAQNNAAPIGAVAGLYGKAAQASDNLGASQEQLVTFADGVGVALKVAGTSATEASGALMQLGQLLGSARVQAEEYNSVNEGARPILIAVANGLDAAGGSVNKLKQLVNDGKVSGKQFFDAFLKGLPSIQAMAANATQTIEQGITRVNNAFTKYIGGQDQAYGASQMLSSGLNALADDFENIADMTLKVASLIAAAFVGRAVGGMLASLGSATIVVGKFVAALRTVRTVSAATVAIGGLGAAAGPLGAILAVATTAALYFATSSDKAGEATESAAKKADRYAEALKRVKGAADAAGKSVQQSGNTFSATETRRLSGQLKGDLDEYKKGAAQVAGEIDAALKRLNQVEPEFASDPDFQQEVNGLKAVNAGLDGTSEGALKAREALDKLALFDSSFSQLANRLGPQLDRLAGIAEAMREGRVDLARASATPMRLPADYQDRQAQADVTRREGLGQQFLEEEKRVNALTDSQKDLENETKRLREALEKTGDGALVSDDQLRRQAQANIDARGGSDAISGFVGRVVGAESRGKADAKNPNSTATGVGQFIESTWLNLFRKYYPQEATQMGRDAILSLRTDATRSKALIELYARENSQILQAAGIAVNGAADEYKLQLAHFLGPQGAIDVLKAAPGTLASKVLDGRAVAANASILGGGRTVDDVIAYGQRRAGQSNAGTDRLDQMDEAAKSYDELIAKGREFIAEQDTEAQAIGMTEKAAAALRYEQQLMAEAQRAGIQLTPQQTTALKSLAQAMADAEFGSAGLRETMEQVADVSRDVFGGFIKDLRDGKSASEALGGALEKLGDRLLDMALDNIFSTKPGGLFNLFGGFFGGGGSSFFPSKPGGLFYEGGYTGAGGRKQPAGVVHKGEVVWNQDDVRRAGGVAAVETMRRGQRGYDVGGPVAMRAPLMPNLSGINRRPAPNISVRGGDLIIQGDVRDTATVADIERRIQANNKQIAYAQENAWRKS